MSKKAWTTDEMNHDRERQPASEVPKSESKQVGDERPSAGLRSLVLLTAAAYCSSLLLYFVAFGPTPSDSQAVWGAFGDFVGGTVNPIAAVVTVYLLWRTYHAQRDELQATRNELQNQNKHLATQAELTDIKRAIEEAYGVWQSLTEPAYYGHSGLSQGLQPVLLGGPNEPKVRRGDVLCDQAHVQSILRVAAGHSEWEPRIREDWTINFAGIPYILAEISTYLADYDVLILGGDSRLTDFYRQRLTDASTTLAQIGMLDPSVATALRRRNWYGPPAPRPE